MHAEISGTVDFKEPNDEMCLARLRSLVGKMGERQGAVTAASFSRIAYDPQRDAPRFAAEDVYGLLNPEPGASNVYDMLQVIARIVDRSEFDEYKAEFGRTVLCGYARIAGRAVGIVANQKTNQSQTVAMGPAAGMLRTEVGGVIYTEGAQKAARFIMDCNQSLVPLLFLHDVKRVHGRQGCGVVGDHPGRGAKMVSAVSTSVVPKITVIVGGSFGAGHYAMCGKSLRSQILVRLADSAICGDERGCGSEYFGRSSRPADGARQRRKILSEVEKRTLHDEIKAYLRCAGRSAVWAQPVFGSTQSLIRRRPEKF